MCEDPALRFPVGLLREWGAGRQGAGRPGFGAPRVEGPGTKAAGGQMWEASPGSGRGQHGHPILQPSGTSGAGSDENGQTSVLSTLAGFLALPVW